VSMRTFLAVVLGVAAVLLASMALPAAWVNQHVVSQEGFVELAGPMGEDEQFRSVLGAAVADEVSEHVELPAVLQDLVQPIIERVARELAAMEEFPAAWNESLAGSHELTMNGQSEAALSLQLTPMASLAAQRVADILGRDLPVADEDIVVSFGQADQRDEVALVKQLATNWYWIAAAAVLAGLLAAVLAVHRTAALLWLGIGVTVAGVLLWSAAHQAAALAGSLEAGSSITDAFAGRLVELAAEDFQPWAIVLAGAGLAAAVLALTARQLTWATKVPSRQRLA
jgi:hypothetical protein